VNKDSLRNIRETGEFVVNVVTEELALQANATSAEFSPSVDEWEIAQVTPVPSDDVRPPRIGESPASFECRVVTILDLGPAEQPTNSIVVGRVTRIHVVDEVLDGFEPNPDAVGLVGRMGGNLWCRSSERFELARPNSTDPDVVRGTLSR
jgi:flavin reductase (DIM6/NTAB) family NADH-FMN oxidoreductase RutF